MYGIVDDGGFFGMTISKPVDWDQWHLLREY